MIIYTSTTFTMSNTDYVSEFPYLELCRMKNEMMETQHSRAEENETLEDRVTYFLDCNIEDSDVNECVKFKVNSHRLHEVVEIMREFGVDISKPLNPDDEEIDLPVILPDFVAMDMWYHDRLKYFCLHLRNIHYCEESSESNYNEDYANEIHYTFINITYDQIKSTLVELFEQNILLDIQHPCWKF